MLPIEVAVFPDYRVANPYQRLLYDEFDPLMRVRFCDWRQALDTLSARSADVFHLHWEDAIYRNEADAAIAHGSAQRFLDALDGFLEQGGKLVWTMHNERPHDGKYIEVFEALSPMLARLAHRVVVHHASAAQVAIEVRGVAAEKIVVQPHGHYRDIYPRVARDRSIRERAGVPADARLLLFFGRLDAYKGGVELLRCFERVDARNMHLMIAGKQITPLDELLDGLGEHVRARIIVRNEFVAEAEVPSLLAMADAVATPYRAILTSGTVMLAFSAGKPVVAPDLPGLLEWVSDGRNATVYERGENGLCEAIQTLASLDDAQLDALGREADETARRRPWHPSRTILADLYARLVIDQQPQRLSGGTDWYALD